jgi:hemerythrin-like domain-containing protein
MPPRARSLEEGNVTPTEILKHEHEIILKVLTAAETAAESIERSGELDAEKLSQMLEFFRGFADRCHHGKEEKHLFPALLQRGGAAAQAPVSVMLGEHDQGRSHIKAIAEALPGAAEGEAQAAQAVTRNLRDYVGLLRAHIEKENNILFRIAEEILSASDQESLSEAFARVEAEEMGEGTHEKYHQLAHRLTGEDK